VDNRKDGQEKKKSKCLFSESQPTVGQSGQRGGKGEAETQGESERNRYWETKGGRVRTERFAGVDIPQEAGIGQNTVGGNCS